MSEAAQVVLVLVVMGYVLTRRVLGEPAQGKRMLVLPGILAVVGANDLLYGVPIGFLAATAALNVGFRLLRGLSVRISQRHGVAFLRYTWVTIALWATNLAVRFGAGLLFGQAVSDGLMLPLGLGLVAEGAIVIVRATRLGHRVSWGDDAREEWKTRARARR